MTTTGGNMKELLAWTGTVLFLHFLGVLSFIFIIFACAKVESAKISEHQRKVWGDDEDM